MLLIITLLDCKADSWQQKANLPTGGMYASMSFSIGNKGYTGGGVNSSGFYDGFWEYDQVNNFWTQKANLGSGAKVLGIGFSIGSKGYIGLGQNNFSAPAELWEYDPPNNQWSQKANWGGGKIE